MIIHNPKISGSLQFPSDENGNLITLQVQNGTLETVTLNSSGVDQNVQPSVNYSGSFTGSFVGDGSLITGVAATAFNIDALGSLGGATIDQGDTFLISDAGTEKKVTFSNLEDSVFGNVSGDIAIAAGGASTLASIANSKLANSSITIDGSAISLGGSVTTTNTQLSTEAVQDIAGALVATGGTKTGIAVTYDDDNANMDFVVTFPSQTDENFTTADHDKLDGIEASATADQTDAEIRAAVEAASDSNVFTDDDHSKLNAIEASADVTDAANVLTSLPSGVVSGSSQISGVTNTQLAGSIAASKLAGSIGNSKLSNSAVTISGTSVSLGGSITDETLFGGTELVSGSAQITKNKSDVGLGNVDNTTDALKPVSTAGQTALNLKANLASPSLTGNPTAPTQADNDDSTKIATTAYVQREVSDLLGGAPAAFDTLLEISASIANGDSDVVALTTTVGTKLAKASNLSDLANASTSRTNLGVDAAGTDNSTNVTLVTDSHDYLSVSGQAITLGSITNDDLAGSIAASKLAGSIGNSKLSNSSITIDGSAISLGGSVSTLQLGTSNSTALAGDTTTISSGQASAITANTAKNTNVSTNLSISGTTGARTIASSDGTNAIIPIATTSVSGVMSKAIFDEHVLNNAKNTNVSTDLSKTTATGQITINSSDGDNVVIGEATATIAGLMSTTHHDKLDGIESSADVTDTANVTSAGALMDSELSSISDVKALDQSVVSGATPTFTVTNFSDVSNKRFMSDAQETLLNSVETNADVTDTANVKSSLNASLGGAANIGDGSDTITIPGDLVVTGTTTTENVTTLTTSNGIVFEGSVADEHEATLKAGTLSADRTLTLPNATGTIALTSDLATVGAGGLTQQNFTTTLKNKLDGIEGSATADQSNAEIRAAVEAASDSNVFTDDDHSKLNAIEASADVTDTTNVTSAGALMDSEVTNLADVKAFDTSDYLASSVTTISSGQASAITANTAKNTNVSTNLSITGTTGARTIASSDGTNAIIPIATTSVSGLLSPGLFDEIDANTAKTGITSGQASAITANTAKNTNVSTNLTATTATTQITINSSDGDNVVIGEATGTIAGLMSTTHHNKLDGIETGADVNVVDSVAGKTGTVTLVKGDVGLGNVDNTTDALKPVSTAGQTALDLKANLASPTFTGVPISTTPADNDNSTKIATTAFVMREVSDLIGGAPGTLDTLNELAAAINDDDDYSSTLTTALATKLVKASNLSDLSNAGTARTNLGVDAAGTDNSTNVTLAGSLDYLTISGQAITRNAIVLTTDVSGVLPSANMDADTAHLSGTQTFSGAKTFSSSTASTSKTTGAVIVTGGVGIGGALNVGGDVVAFASSDERLKDNIELISNPIERVQALRGVTWDWNSNADILQQTLPNVGVIAQDVEKVLPQLVTNRDNGYKGVDYAKLTGLLIEAVKDQQKQIDELKSKLS